MQLVSLYSYRPQPSAPLITFTHPPGQNFIQALLQQRPSVRMELDKALLHPWLAECHQQRLHGTTKEREATASPHSSSQALPDVSMAGPSVASAMVVDEDGAPVSSPPNVIPGAYPSSQLQPLQRRRKVLDEAREAGGAGVLEPTPEMLERARAEEVNGEGVNGAAVIDGPGDTELQAAESNETVKGKKKGGAAPKRGGKAKANGSRAQVQPQNSRPPKRKADSASPMDEDGEPAQDGEEATTPTEANPRGSRRGRGGAAGGRSRGGQKAASEMSVGTRRSTRTAAAKRR